MRRVPFGRVYAIRREMDGQCLGLIRDGNTATIVDVVPKSLSARHGLPPKVNKNYLYLKSMKIILNSIYTLLGSIVRWSLVDILGFDRSKRSSVESFLQGK